MSEPKKNWYPSSDSDKIVNRNDNIRIAPKYRESLEDLQGKKIFNEKLERLKIELREDIAKYESRIKANPREVSYNRYDQNDIANDHLEKMKKMLQILENYDNNQDIAKIFAGVNDAVSKFKLPFFTYDLFKEGDKQRMYDQIEKYPLISEGEDLVKKYEELAGGYKSEVRKKAEDITEQVLDEGRGKIVEKVPIGEWLDMLVDPENYAKYRENKRKNPEDGDIVSLSKVYIPEVIKVGGKQALEEAGISGDIVDAFVDNAVDASSDYVIKKIEGKEDSSPDDNTEDYKPKLGTFKSKYPEEYKNRSVYENLISYYEELKNSLKQKEEATAKQSSYSKPPLNPIRGNQNNEENAYDSEGLNILNEPLSEEQLAKMSRLITSKVDNNKELPLINDADFAKENDLRELQQKDNKDITAKQTSSPKPSLYPARQNDPNNKEESSKQNSWEMNIPVYIPQGFDSQGRLRREEEDNLIYPSINKQVTKQSKTDNFEAYVKIVDDLNSTYTGSAPLTVVRDELDFIYELAARNVTGDLLTESIELLESHKGYSGEACYIPSLDHIYLIADRISDKNKLQEVWLHENIHAAIRALKGKYSSQILNNIYESVGLSKIKKIVPEEYFNSYADHETLTQEYLGRLVQEYIPRRGIGSFLKNKRYEDIREEEKDVNLFLKHIFDYICNGIPWVNDSIPQSISGNKGKRFAGEGAKRFLSRLKNAGFNGDFILDENLFDSKIVEFWLNGRPMMWNNYKPYGFTMSDELICLDTRLIKDSTPVNRLGHLWVNLLRKNNPELYNRGMLLITNSPYHRNVRTNMFFSGRSPENICREAMSFALADKGRAGLHAGRYGHKVADWIRDVWEWSGMYLGIKNISPIQLQNLTLGELAEMI